MYFRFIFKKNHLLFELIIKTGLRTPDIWTPCSFVSAKRTTGSRELQPEVLVLANSIAKLALA